MAQLTLLQKKAEEFNIEVDETKLWLVRTCKRILEGHQSWLQLSHHKIIPKIECMEEELLEVKNELEKLFKANETPKFGEKNSIHRMTNLLQEIRTAYAKISIAFSRNEDRQRAENNQAEDDIAAPHEFMVRCLADISSSFYDCQDAIQRALECFDRSL